MVERLLEAERVGVSKAPGGTISREGDGNPPDQESGNTRFDSEATDQDAAGRPW